MDDPYIEVDCYVMGVYRGKRKIRKDSISGLILSGEYEKAFTKTQDMKKEIDRIVSSVRKELSDAPLGS